MAEEAEATPLSSSPPPPTPTAATDDRPSTSSDVVQEEVGNIEEEEDSAEAAELIPRQPSVSLRAEYSARRRHRPAHPPIDLPEEEETSWFSVRDDTLHCVIVITTFWFFVALTLILGIYGSETIELSPYSSILLQPNPLLVQSVKVEKSDGRKSAAVLYSMYKVPSLNGSQTWSNSLNASVGADSHKEWPFFLNKGSELNISYNVPSSSPLMLIIAQGEEEMAEWLEDPTYPGTTLSWNMVHGSGEIKQHISKSSYYYVALGNLNTEDVEVQLKFQMRSSIYDTTDAYYKCSVAQGLCSVKVLFPKGNAAVLSSPDLQEGTQSEILYVELSYEPRWLTYFAGIGGMTSLMLLAFKFLSKYQCDDQGRNRVQRGGLESERDPLLTPKDDDVLSLGSSYDTDPNSDEENLEDLEASLYEGKVIGDGQSSSSIRQLCVICFDAPRNCFFLPCGHCAACFDCATRIAEDAGTCPICRRAMKKIRKIFSV